MNKVLAEIESSGQVETADLRKVDVHSHVSAEEAALIRAMILRVRPKESVEVGLAFGISAIHICDVLSEFGCNGTHHVIDPMQHGDRWQGIGLLNLERAGFGGRIDFIEKSSHIALPELESRGVMADFILIDGWHTFDHTLVDFFLADKILRVGGVMVIDDMDMSAVRKVGRWIVTNRGYKVVAAVGEESSGWRRKALRAASRFAGPIAKPELRRTDASLGLHGECIAFQKTTDDAREWNHYSAF